jgi:outer membrane protein, multidrug efflux system
MRSTYLGAAVVALLPACSVVPTTSYVEPAIEVPARFMGGPSSALPDAANAAWWTELSDPILNNLVSTGLAQNLDISAAMARMDAARAAARGAGLPEQFNGGINASATRSRDDDGFIDNDVGAGLNGGFVLDLFGQASSSGARAAAQADAAGFDVGAVRLAYLAEVIGNYIDARFFQASAAITRQSVATRRQTLELIEGRADVGEATELELAQARSILASAEAVLPGLEAGFNAAAIRIAALIGRSPDEVIRQLQRGAPQPRPRGNLSVGIPADLIRNRPDVRSAERTFAAAVANVGVSEANLYPSLSILGSIRASTDTTWAFGPVLDIPLFDLPVRLANRDAAVASARAAELDYRATVRDAVGEAETAFMQLQLRRREVAGIERAAAATSEVSSLSRESFGAGEALLLDVLDAERSSLESDLQLARATRDLAADWSRLQISIGKGWLVGARDVRVVEGG